MPRTDNTQGHKCAKCNTKGTNRWRGEWYCDDHLNEDMAPLHVEDFVSMGSMGHHFQDEERPDVTYKEGKEGTDKLIKSAGLVMVYRGYTGGGSYQLKRAEEPAEKGAA